MRHIPKWYILNKGRKSKNNLELVKLTLIPITLGFLFLMGALLTQLKIYADQVPTKETIDQVLKDKGENSKIYDRDGRLLYIFKDPVQDREYAEFEELPPEVIAAVLAAEDEGFFLHEGIDYLGTIKGLAITLASGGENKVGGSTITQQLVKQTLLTNERTVDRKAKEAIIAMMVEESYSKQEILEYYLNITSYGGRVIGIRTAAAAYFNKPLKKLNLSEAAFLVGLIQSPSEYSPIYANNKEQASKLSEERRLFILNQILENDKLMNFLRTGDLKEIGLEEGTTTSIKPKENYNAEIVGKLKDTEPKFRTRKDFIKAPHFVFYVRDILQQQPYNLTLNDLYRGGYKIYTSLDLKMQQAAQKKLKQGVNDFGWRYGFENGAVVSIDARTGEILVMVGSKGYNLRNNPNNRRFDPKVNVTTSNQTLGSSLKPWVAYLAFSRFGAKYNPATEVEDSPQTFPSPTGPYSPKNADGKYMGKMSIATALLLSRNLPFLKIAHDIGWWQLPNLMTQIGYRKNNNYGLSATIGGVDESLLNHTAAYTGLANGGKVMKQIPVLRIVDAEGKKVYEADKNKVIYQLDRYAVAQVNSILGDKSFTSGNYWMKFIYGNKLAGKTGTSDENRDTYYIGYNPRIVTGVWTGNNDNTPMVGWAYGSNTALPVWNEIMREVLFKFPKYKEYGSY